MSWRRGVDEDMVRHLVRSAIEGVMVQADTSIHRLESRIRDLERQVEEIHDRFLPPRFMPDPISEDRRVRVDADRQRLQDLAFQQHRYQDMTRAQNPFWQALPPTQVGQPLMSNQQAFVDFFNTFGQSARRPDPRAQVAEGL